MLLESSFMLLENIYSTGMIMIMIMVNYNHHIFIVQATGFNIVKLFFVAVTKKYWAFRVLSLLSLLHSKSRLF